MSKKTVGEMSHRPGNMSEESDYVLSTLKPLIDILAVKLSSKAEKSEVLQVYNKIENNKSIKDLIKSVNILSDRINVLTSAMQAVCEKLDTEDVSNLDDDYKDTLTNILNGGN